MDSPLSRLVVQPVQAAVEVLERLVEMGKEQIMFPREVLVHKAHELLRKTLSKAGGDVQIRAHSSYYYYHYYL